MKKIILNTRLLLLVCIAMSIGLGTSCKNDEPASSSKVELLSYGPAGSKLGDTISFIGKNLDKVLTIKFVGDSVPKASFLSQTATLIKLIVPMNTTKGFVMLRTATEIIVTKTMFDLLVPVTVTTVTASVRPGDNITITGTNVGWITQVVFPKDLVVPDSMFVSKSLNQIVVKVPKTAKSGALTFNTGGTKPLSISSENDLIVVLPAVTAIDPIPVDRGGNLTITGTDLDLVKGIMFKGVTDTIKAFVSQSATQIVVTVPVATTQGPLSLVAFSNVLVASPMKVQLVGDLQPLAPLAYAFYEDALMNGWQNWGWGSTVDLANTENVRDGNNAIKATFTGSWGAIKFANGSVATSTYTDFVFSVYGGPGTDGKTFNVLPTGGSTFSAVIKEGAWVEIVIPLSTLGNVNPIKELMMQETAWSGFVYLDHIGFR